jgi:hypothetical protein
VRVENKERCLGNTPNKLVAYDATSLPAIVLTAWEWMAV